MAWRARLGLRPISAPAARGLEHPCQAGTHVGEQSVKTLEGRPRSLGDDPTADEQLQERTHDDSTNEFGEQRCAGHDAACLVAGLHEQLVSTWLSPRGNLELAARGVGARLTGDIGQSL